MVSVSPAECRGVFQIAEKHETSDDNSSISSRLRLMNDYNSGIRIGNGDECINLKKQIKSSWGSRLKRS